MNNDTLTELVKFTARVGGQLDVLLNILTEDETTTSAILAAASDLNQAHYRFTVAIQAELEQ